MDIINEKILVSIIMPAYNSGNYIEEAIDSVLKQTYENWELLIVDDKSTDNTLNLIKKYSLKDSRIKYTSLNRNSGPAIVRNKAIDMASGDYIAFLDSDDLWFERKLEKQITFMYENNYNFTCTSYTKIDKTGQSLNRTVNTVKKLDYWEVLKNCPGNSTVIYNSKKLGKFKIPDIKKRNDYVMWLKIIKETDSLYGIKEPLGSHRVHKNGISKNKFDLVKYHWFVYRKMEKLSIIQSAYLISYLTSKTIIKKILK